MHPPTPMPDDAGPGLRDTARYEGADAALNALHRWAGAHTLVQGPAGHALAPAALVAGATRAGRPGALAPRRPDRERELTTPLLAAFGLVAVHAGEAPANKAPSAEYTSWDTAVVWLRLGLTQRLLDAVLAHLATRTFGDTPLLRQPVLKTALSAAAVSLLEAESALTAGREPDSTGARQLHDTLTATDRSLLKLLGAWGLTTDGPGSTAYISELLADVYAPAAPSPYEAAA
ncbi:hypothetical protein OG239_41945 (plasmid) [Streptomyces sp. NBC_00868]|uniref:hypothetical protein n=1 Tax=Streptomyces sp. NBC_00868 TaxID=2903683 RepID=UPI002F9077B2|nr:hypothetical protein OG239_41945 [Streptomyces sp. NBC_00868]